MTYMEEQVHIGAGTIHRVLTVYNGLIVVLLAGFMAITQQKINSKFANDDKRIELLVRQQTINNWLTGAIASGIIALLIKVFLGG